MKKTINLFFIGDRFYEESRSMMSPIYVKETKERYDWGFVNIALREGHTINIKPATRAEMKWAEDKLKDMQSRYTMINDPVKYCDVYKSEGCSHVDGYLCNYPYCSILKEWKENNT